MPTHPGARGGGPDQQATWVRHAYRNPAWVALPYRLGLLASHDRTST